jgi:uncharacterized protein YdeI (YjbR/CyaY-like superfamily)
MTNGGMTSQVDLYIKKAKKWQEELAKLRTIILDCQLNEEVKWGKPCYSFQKSNIVILLPLKDHCSLLFCKGALLKDPEGVLVKAGENTQAARQMRFRSVGEIEEKESVLKSYINDAIEAEKAGLRVKYKEITDFAVPEELQNKLDESAALKTAFKALTPGRQRAYFIYFSAPKQSKTRTSRVDKCLEQILKGKGLDDK